MAATEYSRDGLLLYLCIYYIICTRIGSPPTSWLAQFVINIRRPFWDKPNVPGPRAPSARSRPSQHNGTVSVLYRNSRCGEDGLISSYPYPLPPSPPPRQARFSVANQEGALDNPPGKTIGSALNKPTSARPGAWWRRGLSDLAAVVFGM